MSDTNEQQPQWYSRGKQGLQQETVRMDAQASVRWFECKQDGEKFVTFLEDESFNLHMHEFRQGKEFGLRCTCIKPVYPEDAVCCHQLGPKSLSFFSMYSVIDIEGYKPKGKPPVPYNLVPLGAKFGAAKLIEAEREAATSLIGARVRVTRTGVNAPRSGNNFRSMPWTRDGKTMGNYLSKEQWAGLAKVVTYRGKKLVDSIRAVNAAVLKGDFSKRDAMAKVFLIDPLMNPDGTLQEGLIPSFNFLSMFAPLTPRELRAQLSGATVDDFGERTGAGGGADKDFGGGGSSGPSSAGPAAPRADDDIPF